MPRDFNIITNIANGAGLQKDYELLKFRLELYGNNVRGIQYTDWFNCGDVRANVNIFIEVVPMQFLNMSPDNWLIPNSEWWDMSRQICLPRISTVLCKTHDSLNIWEKRAGIDRCHFIGFESPDYYDPSITKLPSVLHLAGKSGTKNTVAVVEAWRKYWFHLPPLTVVTNNPEFEPLFNNGLPPNVTRIKRVTDESLPRLINSHLFHLMPAQYEGFGHVIHEALGCGGIVITTNAAPMNESAGVPKEFAVPVSETYEKGVAQLRRVDPEGIAAAVCRATGASLEKLSQISAQARETFLTEREEFRIAFDRIIR